MAREWDRHRASLAERFARFAERECRGVSALYERLARGVADDPELLGLAAEARAGQPPPNLLFGAVHHLLLLGARHPVSAFYASLGGSFEAGGDDPYPAFRAFCREHRAEIAELLRARLVQTNEVRRCALLLPAFGLVAREAGLTLTLIEIGASAGLNLLFDRYGYDYGLRRYGERRSTVQLRCEPRGPRRPPIPHPLPGVAARIGLDLEPVDVRDERAVAWLRALVWPDEAERAELLARAVELARREPPTLVAGDALEVLPDLWPTLPERGAICVVHTHTLNQWSPADRERLADLLAGYSERRTVYRVAIEAVGEPHPVLNLTVYDRGRASERRLAYCDAHGAWIEWLNDGSPGLELAGYRGSPMDA